jgi:hypothetical protein
MNRKKPLLRSLSFFSDTQEFSSFCPGAYLLYFYPIKQELIYAMVEKPVEVSTYSGYRGEESPRAFILDGKRIEVRMVLEQWIEEDAATKVGTRGFRVTGDDFRNHILRYLEVEGVWMHEGEAENG